MRLNRHFISYTSAGEQILVDVTSHFSGLIRSNPTAAYIVECLQNDTTEEQIVCAMLDKYDAPREVIAGDVARILQKLRSVGALEEGQ